MGGCDPSRQRMRIHRLTSTSFPFYKEQHDAERRAVLYKKLQISDHAFAQTEDPQLSVQGATVHAEKFHRLLHTAATSLQHAYDTLSLF